MPCARGGAALLAGLFELIWPRFCLACAERLAAGDGPLGLCARCRTRLAPVDPRRACRGCLSPLPAGRDPLPLCLGCRRQKPPYERAIALWRYRPPATELVRAFKFHRVDHLGEAFAEAAEAAGLLAPLADVDMVVPVPLAWPRLLGRGFNQAERFGRPVARRLGVPLVRALARRGLPGTQAGSTRRERLARAPGSFRTRSPERLLDRHLLLVDDVLTTGATARSAAAALRAAGARAVTVLVVAWTPPGSPPGSP
ncbi:MAG: ComF family protein [Thermoanaerobaculia bacterium]|nr:ComF family protein [Thermoanaerobaculia bacterium]